MSALIDAVILSHNHNDHTDGLLGILRENKDIPVYVHKDWDRERLRNCSIECAI